jgi:type I restriction-modification system DNA methylase subunit
MTIVHSDHQKRLVQLIKDLGRRHDVAHVFTDFVEFGALSISNAVDSTMRAKRERRYLQIASKYGSTEMNEFAEMLAALALALDREPTDVLGRTFHLLELQNRWRGQFFSPLSLCIANAKLIIKGRPECHSALAEHGFIRVHEPAAGSGSMIIALAIELDAAGIDYRRQLHVVATDVDPKCAHMSYLQLSLLQIPGVVVHGNSLSLEETTRWHTPTHVWDGWTEKLRAAATESRLTTHTSACARDEEAP